MADIYVNSLTGDDTAADGSRRHPYQTWAAANAEASSGDTLYMRGTFTENVSLQSGVDLVAYGTGRFVIDGESTRAFCLRVTEQVVDCRVVGAELTGATSHGFEHGAYCENVRFFDCYSHDNGGSGFQNPADATDGPNGSIALFGCVAESNTLDGFSVHRDCVWYCYDCIAIDHDSGASTDGFTTHNDAIINAYRCEVVGATKGFAYTHDSERPCVVANCATVDTEIGFYLRPSGTLTAGQVQPKALVFGSLFVLNGESVNAEQTWGVSSGNGAHVDCICNTVDNAGGIGDGDEVYSFAQYDADNPSGQRTTIRVLGNVSQLANQSEAFHGRRMDPGDVPDWDLNIYRSRTGNRFSLDTVPRDEANWLSRGDGMDNESHFIDDDLLLGSPASASDFELGRLSAVGLAARVGSVTAYLAQRGISEILDPLVLPAELTQPDDVNFYNNVLGPRKYAVTDSCYMMGLSGGPLETDSPTMTAGAFSEGTRTTQMHRGDGVRGGSFILANHDIGSSGLSDVRVNLLSILGDRTRRIRLVSADYQITGMTTPNTVRLTAGSLASGKIVGLLLGNHPQEINSVILPAGEDLIINLAAVVGSFVNLTVNYVIDSVSPASLRDPQPAGLAFADV